MTRVGRRRRLARGGARLAREALGAIGLVATSAVVSLAVLESLLAVGLARRHLFPLDGHPNAAGHRLLARLVTAELARRGVTRAPVERPAAPP